MKNKFLIIGALLMGMSFGFTACDDDDDNNDSEFDSAANINYTAENSASWLNYTRNVATLLRNDAESLYNAWAVDYNGQGDFATAFKNHATSDYSSALSCIEQIIDGCTDIANEVGTSKIGEPYALYIVGKKTEALYAVESWYSWHSKDDYTNNIYSVRNAYYGSRDGVIADNSIASLIKENNPTLHAEVVAAIELAASTIQAIPTPFRNNIASAETVAAMTACESLQSILDKKLKPELASFEDAALEPIVESYVDNVVLPTYTDLRNGNAALYEAVAALAENPSDDTFKAAANAWLEAREPWETSEAFLFGPVDELGLDPNMDSWPLDQVAIVNILNSKDWAALEWSEDDDDEAIEAVQNVRGFHTLEFLLFKDGQPRKVSE